MTIAVLLAVVLVVSTFLFHFMVLHWLSHGMLRINVAAGAKVLIIVLVLLTAHVIEVCFYTGAYILGDRVLEIGGFGGSSVVDPVDYLYFSLVSYTSLGLGDIFPTEHLRFITGIEALNGLLLIAWTGSFIYVAMSRLWSWQQSEDPSANAEGSAVGP